MHPDEFTPSQFAERRGRTDDSTLLHIKELQTSIKELKAQMTYHHGVFEERVEKAINGVFERAFPEGDPEGHRLHHELVIKREEERVEFWMAMRKEIGKWGLIGVLGFIIVSMWHTFLQGPPK